MRVFIAVDVESREALERLVELQRLLVGCGADLKLVEPQNLHFTLKFLGEVDAEIVDRLKQILSGVEFQPIKILYQGLGAFPSLSHPNVIWVGSDKEGGSRLSRLASIVEARTVHLRLGDTKPFKPHLSIARVKSGRRRDELIKIINSNSNTIFGEDLLTKLKLKKSDLTPRGPIYTDLYTKPLVG